MLHMTDGCASGGGEEEADGTEETEKATSYWNWDWDWDSDCELG